MLFSRCVFCEKNGQITSDAFVMFPNMHKHTHMSEQNKQIYIGTNHTNIYRNKTNKTNIECWQFAQSVHCQMILYLGHTVLDHRRRSSWSIFDRTFNCLNNFSIYYGNYLLDSIHSCLQSLYRIKHFVFLKLSFYGLMIFHSLSHRYI